MSCYVCYLHRLDIQREWKAVNDIPKISPKFCFFFLILYNLYRKVRCIFSGVRSKILLDEYSSKFEWLSIKAAWWKAFFLGNVTHFKNLAIQRLDAVYNLPNMGQQEGFIFKLYDNCMHIWANLGL